MSDTESDSLLSNVFTFQNENTIISAKGPRVNNTNMTNLTFRNNVLSSTMHMPRNFERQQFTEPSFDQRSMCFRRETSPASMYSGSDMRARNFHQSFYRGGPRSQRSMYYGRSGSPMSMRSMDSNASVSATDIALAFKNVNFNKHDLRLIKDAYNKFMKRRIQNKIEKRRNMRLFLKSYRRKSGYDSGEQGSASSISSDDCKSTSSAMYKDNMSCRSTRTDIINFRRTIRENIMYKDCSDSFKQNAFKNIYSVPPGNARDRLNAPDAVQTSVLRPQHEFAVPNPVHKPTFTQKDRFKNGYLLPSQRFNKSVASVPIPERDPRLQARQNTWHSKNTTTNEMPTQNEHVNNDMDTDQEEIFSEVTIREKGIQNCESQFVKITDNGKRGLEIDSDNKCPDSKRPKLSSPVKQSNKTNNLLKEKPTNLGTKNNKKNHHKNKDDEIGSKEHHNNTESTENEKSDEFEFLKPQFPVRKSGPSKPKEQLISKSAQPLDEIMPQSKPQQQITDNSASIPKPALENQPAVNRTEEQDLTQHSNSDLSMRPSFIKRKLFTQKMDVTEKKNLSSGALNVNSPQTNVYSAIQKEKHKARKLVTNQSCLSRDVAQEGNNLLDLIHKIVPPDRMNITNVTNKTSISHSVSSKNPINDDDKWDVTSVISTCNNEDVSDTFTDEEIFAVNETKKNVDVKKKDVVKVVEEKENHKTTNNVQKVDLKKSSVNVKKSSECRILVEKLSENNLLPKTTSAVNKPVTTIQDEDNNKKSAYNCVKSFWDTDFESDMESPAPPRTRSRSSDLKVSTRNVIGNKTLQANVVEGIRKPNVSLATVSDCIKSKAMPTNSLGVLREFNISKTLSIKSYLTPKQLKCNPKMSKEDHKGQDIKDASDATEPVKRAVKQNTKSKSNNNNDIQNKKSEAKKTNKKNNDDLLNTSTKTTQSKVNAKTVLSHAKPNKKSVANKSITEATPGRSPRNKTTKKVNTEKEQNSKSNIKTTTNNNVTEPKTRGRLKKDKSDANADISQAITTRSPKIQANPKPTKIQNGKPKATANQSMSESKTSKNPKTQTNVKSKTAKAVIAEVNNKTIANISISGLRSGRTPSKRKACCDESNDSLNVSTRSSTRKQNEKNSRTKTR